ncbi:MAG: DUF4238 domain-containing protein [Anaerolineales bacterium]|nr:DUF4238 domain-containing protein [Anaerolineales bacterium]
MSRTKNEHYVPQSYLARFTDDGEHLYVYDKSTKRKFRSHIRNIAAENLFYDQPNKPTQYLEKTFANTVDQLYPQLVDSLLETVVDKGLSITKSQKELLALYLALQSTRTRWYRNLIIKTLKTLETAFQDLATHSRKKNTELKPSGLLKQILTQDTEELAKSEHIASIVDSKTINQRIMIFMRHIWVFGINQTMIPFYASDNPVAVWAHKQDTTRSFSGFRSEGIEIAFPLTSSYILSLFERTYHSQLIPLDGKSIFLPDSNLVNHLNSMQVVNSHRWIYSAQKGFNIIEE